jgi:hypothetical protein
VAHSILVIAYQMLRNGVDFPNLGADFDRINRQAEALPLAGLAKLRL